MVEVEVEMDVDVDVEVDVEEEEELEMEFSLALGERGRDHRVQPSLPVGEELRCTKDVVVGSPVVSLDGLGRFTVQSNGGLKVLSSIPSLALVTKVCVVWWIYAFSRSCICALYVLVLVQCSGVTGANYDPRSIVPV